MKYFDYTFYRIYIYYNKYKDTPNFTAILFLFMLQGCVLFGVIITINGFTNHTGTRAYLGEKQFWLLYGLIMSVLFIGNIIRYARKRKVAFYVSLFKGNRLNGIIPTWVIFIQPLVFILLAILINIIVKSMI